ncbi:hypothetical protein QAD02_014988 [Eretmocerus hayati]|uniref:Uncharacterized protein n=1 Tax=Eretmocerus hayati TaxID=131215 RepID=A0ACC2P898_9HYME|nr:hypothetical protein QAD02_014988 [Eretmocerus hayati]
MSLLYWPTSTGKRIVYVLAVSTATDLVYHFFKYLTSNKKSQPEPEKDIAETLFFSSECLECKHHVNTNVPCERLTCPFRNLNKIITHILSARKTLEVCVYFFTFNSIARALIEAHRRNVVIRVITDEESSGNDSSQAFNLRRAGLRVRSKKFEHTILMHHKFVVIDGKVLITGSANWTGQAFFGNFENVIITNQKEIVRGYSQEFESLWETMSADVGDQPLEEGARMVRNHSS